MEDMSEFGDDEIQRYRRKIGIIFQDYQLINSLTPKQNIIYPLVLESTPLTTIKKKYDAVNKLLDISSIETTEIKKLSG
jgi:ABC-type methionine transport system ATPase subunit